MPIHFNIFMNSCRWVSTQCQYQDYVMENPLILFQIFRISVVPKLSSITDESYSQNSFLDTEIVL